MNERILHGLALALVSPFFMAAQDLSGGMPSPSIVQDGLLAEYTMQSGSGGILADATGNGYDAKFPRGPAAPGWSATGLSFNDANRQYVLLPGNLTGQVVTVQIVGDWSNNGWPGGSATVGALFSSPGTAGVSVFPFTSMSPTSTPIPQVWFRGLANTMASSGCLGPCDYAVVFGSPTRVYVNGAEAAFYQVQGSTSAAVSGPYMLGAAPAYGSYLNGTLFYALLYNRALAAGEIRQNHDALAQVLAQRAIGSYIFNDPVNHIYAIGDSITAGNVGGVTPWPSLLSTADSFSVENLGMGGQKMQAIRYIYANIAPLMIPPGGFRSVVVLFAGINDVTGGRTPQQIYSDLAATGRYFQAAGHQVVVLPMLSASAGAISLDSYKNAFNGLLAANWMSFADAAVDPASAPQLYGDGASANPNPQACGGMPCFQADQVHPTTAGEQVLARLIGAAIDLLPGGP